VGRSTTVWHLGAELALQHRTVGIEDLDQAKHLTNIVQRRSLLVPGLSIDDDGPADVVLLDTAPEADTRAGSAIFAAQTQRTGAQMANSGTPSHLEAIERIRGLSTTATRDASRLLQKR
jgi:hypothetical protein